MHMQFSEEWLRRPRMATQIVQAIPDLGVEVARGQQRPQLHSEDGKPVWGVEVLDIAEEFGRKRTEVIVVRVAADQMPVLAPGPVRFKDLRVTVSTRINRQGTGRDARIVGVTENVYWDASAVEQVRVTSEYKGAA
jgi:hypothetical protein